MLNDVGKKVLSRSNQLISKISDLIHNYMISPLDAFKEFDKLKNGKLTFEEFHNLINVLY